MISEAEGEEALMRFLGCAIFAAIPQEALEEALTTLRDILVFSLEDKLLTLQPQGRQKRLTGTAIGASERPALMIAE